MFDPNGFKFLKERNMGNLDKGHDQADRKVFDSGGKGRNRGGAFGPGGYCVCTKCGKKIPHKQGVKCTTLKCSICGHTMIREELLKKNK